MKLFKKLFGSKNPTTDSVKIVNFKKKDLSESKKKLKENIQTNSKCNDTADAMEMHMCEPKIHFKLMATYINDIINESSDSTSHFEDQSFHQILKLHEYYKSEMKNDQTQMLNADEMKLKYSPFYGIHGGIDAMKMRASNIADRKRIQRQIEKNKQETNDPSKEHFDFEDDQKFLSIHKRGFDLKYNAQKQIPFKHLKNYNNDDDLMHSQRSQYILVEHFDIFDSMFDEPQKVQKTIVGNTGFHMVGKVNGINVSVTKKPINVGHKNKKLMQEFRETYEKYAKNDNLVEKIQHANTIRSIFKSFVSLENNSHSHVLRDCYNMVDLNNLAYYSTLFPMVYHISVGFEKLLDASKNTLNPYVIIIKQHQNCGFTELLKDDIELAKNYMDFHPKSVLQSLIENEKPSTIDDKKKSEKTKQQTVGNDSNGYSSVVSILEKYKKESVKMGDSNYKFMDQDALILQKLNIIESMLGQIIFGLYFAEKTMGFVHNNLRLENICYSKVENKNLDHLRFQTADLMYEVPTHGYIFTIKDFEKSVIKDCVKDINSCHTCNYYDISVVIRDFIVNDKDLFQLYSEITNKNQSSQLIKQFFDHRATKILLTVSKCVNEQDCFNMYPPEYNSHYDNYKKLASGAQNYFNLAPPQWEIKRPNQKSKYSFVQDESFTFARDSRKTGVPDSYYMIQFMILFRTGDDFYKNQKKHLVI